jgi:glycosyltransferase involved in cell wall biosynthesis
VTATVPATAIRPRASVLMPAYNAEATLREAVESVLAQTVDDLELIVADDVSLVPVADILADVADPRLRIVRRERNGGTARARTSALELARGGAICQLDADDVWEPRFLEAMLPELDRPGIGLAYCNVTILGHPDGQTDYIGDTSIHPRDRFPELAEANPVPCPTAVMRADAVHAVGGYRGWLRSVEEWHLYMRLAIAGWRFAYHDEQLARYRWPTAERGMSFDTRRMDRWALIALAELAVSHPRVPGPAREAWRRLPQVLAGRS